MLVGWGTFRDFFEEIESHHVGELEEREISMLVVGVDVPFISHLGIDDPKRVVIMQKNPSWVIQCFSRCSSNYLAWFSKSVLFDLVKY